MKHVPFTDKEIETSLKVMEYLFELYPIGSSYGHVFMQFRHAYDFDKHVKKLHDEHKKRPKRPF